MRVTDRQVQEVILSLRASAGKVSGAGVRAELARRFGGRGGVARVYRLLAEADGTARGGELAEMAQHVGKLEESLAAALHRAELAEYRELAHQDWAASQIYSLREKLREIESSPRLQGVRHEDYLQVHRALAAARQRIAELESERATLQRARTDR